MVDSQVAYEVIWMINILVGLFNQGMEDTSIHHDNPSCIKLFENPFYIIDPST